MVWKAEATVAPSPPDSLNWAGSDDWGSLAVWKTSHGAGHCHGVSDLGRTEPLDMSV